MSEQRITIGVIAKLAEQVEDYDDFYEKLEDLGSKLRPTYGGDMIVFRHQDGPSYETGLIFVDKELTDLILERFLKELEKASVSIKSGTEKVFIDNWYDGCDPPHLNIEVDDVYGENE